MQFYAHHIFNFRNELSQLLNIVFLRKSKIFLSNAQKINVSIKGWPSRMNE